MSELRVLIVAENVSARFGGEAFLPLHYFRVLRARGIEAFVLTHERVRGELQLAFLATEHGRLFFLPDQPTQQRLWRAKNALHLSDFSVGVATALVSQRAQRMCVLKLVREHRITVVHQPTPVSPKLPSPIYDVGAPVLIGPMNGGMDFPPDFAHLRTPAERGATRCFRQIAEVANRLIPGKRRACMLLVANARTRAALPRCVQHVPSAELVENGVDLQRFVRRARPQEAVGAQVHFAFVGRLVHWKAVDVLLDALGALSAELPVELSIFGDGADRCRLEAQAARLGIADRVHFHGFVPQPEVARRLALMDALVLPSLYECGGAVVLEAMALSLPVIATAWGGPADYLDPGCGVLIPPSGRAQFSRDLQLAMRKLALDSALRRRLGEAGRAKVEREFDWEHKVDRILALYRGCIEGRVPE